MIWWTRGMCIRINTRILMEVSAAFVQVVWQRISSRHWPVCMIDVNGWPGVRRHTVIWYARNDARLHAKAFLPSTLCIFLLLYRRYGTAMRVP